MFNRAESTAYSHKRTLQHCPWLEYAKCQDSMLAVYCCLWNDNNSCKLYIKVMIPAGLELAISWFVVRRLIHWATGPICLALIRLNTYPQYLETIQVRVYMFTCFVVHIVWRCQWWYTVKSPITDQSYKREFIYIYNPLFRFKTKSTVGKKNHFTSINKCVLTSWR